MTEEKYIDEVFGASGLLARQFPGYRPREGQLQLTRAIANALRDGEHLVAEAPTGTGKSLSYLAPAIFHARESGTKALVATANIALQEQLVDKDLPLLQRTLPFPFTFALLKGKNNYLCKRALADADVRQGFGMFSDEWGAQARDVLKWSETTLRGDVSELPFVPAPQVWSRFSVSSEDCSGRDCPLYEECFAKLARAAADTADVVVTNYHLLFAHLGVLAETGNHVVLPEFGSVICDEAHDLASIARDFFGVQVSEFTVGNIVREANKVAGLRPFVDKLRNESGRFFENLRHVKHSAQYNVRLRPGKPGQDALRFESLSKQLRALGSMAEAEAGTSLGEREKKACDYVVRRASATAELIDEVCSLEDKDKIYWIEEDSKQRCKLVGKPLDVASVLESELFAHWPVVMVSATITTNGTFDFIRRETGVPREARELIVDSPFNFRRQALLVVPDIVEPGSPSFPGIAAKTFARVVELCNGRTLGLFTSYRNMNAVHEKVSHLPFRILKQGDAPRTELVRTFKHDVHSVLLGTASFWTGVDVSGEALTGLVIDKLPFPTPDDPIVDAISERDSSAFGTYMIPQAIIALRQGVGRLIRSVDDVGVVVILDTRLATKNYGKRFLRALPNMKSTRDVEAIATFLEEANGDEL